MKQSNNKNHIQTPKEVCSEKAWIRLKDERAVDSSLLRRDIVNSWERCLLNGVNPLAIKKDNNILDIQDVLEQYESCRLLETARMHMENLYDAVKDSDDFIVMIADANRVSLDIFGNDKMFDIAEELRIVAGSFCTEEAIGTTAASVCFAEKRPVRVRSYEHFVRDFHRWCCSSAPIFDDQGNLAGVLNLSNINEQKHSPVILNLVAATAKLIELELKFNNLNRKYKKSYHYLSSMLDGISEPVLLFDHQGQINQINKSTAAILGVAAQECIGKNIYQIVNEQCEIKNRHDDRNKSEWLMETSRGRKLICAKFSRINGPNAEILGYIGTFNEVSSGKDRYNKASYTFADIEFCSSLMEQAVNIAQRVAFSDIAVFIHGESGTGKEMFAQAIHNYGDRSANPFIAINCAALPRELIQSELFGYEDAAFTGAKRGGKPGKFELAQGGTVFLDEIGDMPLALQANLLRVLQEKSVVRVGGSKPIPLNVRIISATNKNIPDEIEAGRFRADLYYRLCAMTIAIPPLRDRPQDVARLFRYFLQKHQRQFANADHMNVSTAVMKLLSSYHWPGNVRELENTVLFLLANFPGSTIRVQDMPEKFRQYAELLPPVPPEAVEKSLETLDGREKLTIINTLAGCNGNISKSAAVLGITRATLYRKIKKYNIAEY